MFACRTFCFAFLLFDSNRPTSATTEMQMFVGDKFFAQGERQRVSSHCLSPILRHAGRFVQLFECVRFTARTHFQGARLTRLLLSFLRSLGKPYALFVVGASVAFFQMESPPSAPTETSPTALSLEQGAPATQPVVQPNPGLTKTQLLDALQWQPKYLCLCGHTNVKVSFSLYR